MTDDELIAALRNSPATPGGHWPSVEDCRLAADRIAQLTGADNEELAFVDYTSAPSYYITMFERDAWAAGWNACLRAGRRSSASTPKGDNE